MRRSFAKWRYSSAPALAVLLGACASGPWPPHPLLPAGTTLADAVPTSMVRLSPATAAREEPVHIFGQPRGTYITGPAWAAVFAGAAPFAKAEISAVQSVLAIEVVALGFASKYSYSATASLQCRGSQLLLSGNGYSHSMAGTDTNAREAVAMALNAIARQAESIAASPACSGS